MNPRTTWFLVIAAIALAVYIGMTDGQKIRVPSRAGEVTFTPPSSKDITAIQIIRSNTVIRVERAGGGWQLKDPVDYPAQTSSIEAFLAAIEKLQPQSYLPASTWNQQPDAKRQLGLETPASLTLQTRRGPWILQLGGLTALGNRFYFQQVGDDGVFTADLAFVATLPGSAADWRDHSLIDFQHIAFDRIEISGRAQLEAVRDRTSGWKLIRPLEARANNEQFQRILEMLQRTEIIRFVSDSPSTPLDDFGLQPPAAQLIFKLGTNEVSRLQFGRPPTNAPDSIFVRRTSNNNVVTVKSDAAVLLQQPLGSYRDKRLLPPLDGAARIEISSLNNSFAVEKEGTNWFLAGTNRTLADPYSTAVFLHELAGLRIDDFADDIVGDPARYGFDKPQRAYSVYGTNGLITSLALGLPYGSQNRVYAQRSGESSAYGVSFGSTVTLPQIAAQLRNWRFDPTNVTRITIEEKGQTRIMERSSGGDWKAAGASLGPAGSQAIDETVYRLSQINTPRFPAPPEATWPKYAITEVDHHLTIELSGANPFKTLRIDFGGRPNNVNQFALAQFDGGERVLIEFPYALYQNEVRYYLGIGNGGGGGLPPK